MLRSLPRASRRFSFLLAALLLVILPQAYAAPVPTRITLAISSEDAGASAGKILTATIRTAIGTPVDAGTVDFLLPNGQSLGSAVVDAQGTATLPLPQTVSGPSVTAAYHAGLSSGSFLDGSSAALALPAATTLPDFIVTGNPTTVTTAQGSFGATAITVSSVAGYAGSMEFSCSNLPAQVTCAFNPIQQSLAANGSFVSTLELETQAGSGPQSRLWPHGSTIAYALIVPGAMVFFGLARRRKGGQWLAVVLVVVSAGAGLSGCSQRYGYLHHPPPVAGGTPAGTYTITVAVDGAVGATVTEHDIPITLVVQ